MIGSAVAIVVDAIAAIELWRCPAFQGCDPTLERLDLRLKRLDARKERVDHGPLLLTGEEELVHIGLELGHVGIVRERHVVHASTSRQRVVEDAIDALTLGARRIERVRFEALCAAFARFVGRSSIELPGE